MGKSKTPDKYSEINILKELKQYSRGAQENTCPAKGWRNTMKGYGVQAKEVT